MSVNSVEPLQTRNNQVCLGASMREELPFPIVYYPNHYGTFIAFAENWSSTPFLCSCAVSAVENLLRLHNKDELRNTPLEAWYFPNELVSRSIEFKSNPLESLSFKDALCHRCNLATPSLRWCHEMYGGQFAQRLGWYINQTYLRLGITPSSFHFLPDVCPAEYQQMILTMKRANNELFNERTKLNGHETDPRIIALRRTASRVTRILKNSLENITRQEFGHRNVGEGWVSETLLYQIVQRLFPSEQILRHYRPEWLNGLEIDIFLPNLQVAIEYQGQQHFYAIDAWGGEKALALLEERDSRKEEFCKRQNIKLIAIDYTEPLTEQHIGKRLKKVKQRGRTAHKR
jgi:hypothetical protein